MATVKVYGDLYENNLPVDSGGVSNIYPDFVQNVPTAEWVINHNSGRYRDVSAFTVGGVRMEGDIILSSINQTRVQFLIPVAGFAVFTN